MRKNLPKDIWRFVEHTGWAIKKGVLVDTANSCLTYVCRTCGMVRHVKARLESIVCNICGESNYPDRSICRSCNTPIDMTKATEVWFCSPRRLPRICPNCEELKKKNAKGA